MKLIGKFVFMGARKQPSFKDPSKTTYLVGFVDGLDSLRCYTEPEIFNQFANLQPFSEVSVELDYNPVSNRVNLAGLISAGKEKV